MGFQKIKKFLEIGQTELKLYRHLKVVMYSIATI